LTTSIDTFKYFKETSHFTFN